MKHEVISIRPFLGAKNFDISSEFYVALGFKQTKLDDNLSYFSNGSIGFYLQKAYIKDWVDNTMLFMEVQDVEKFWTNLLTLELDKKFDKVRLDPIRTMDWGKECFIHDPSGILWHIGEFFKRNESID